MSFEIPDFVQASRSQPARLAWILLAAGMLLCGAFPGRAQTERVAESPAAKCAALARADFTGNDEAPSRITATELIEPRDRQPGYCRVSGYVWPQVYFELLLPTADWNGKLFQLGCGG